jgi:GT2 family glycosyltransferase/SAM-dependent methyltransferase
MSLQRRAGAPRLIEWTGERCVPWSPDVQVVYEHMHRYLWASKLVGGKRVLDLGSGEGFGASLLAESAETVVGVDIDEQTVEHAQLNWSGPRINFQVGSAIDLSPFADGTFGAVVAFEIIEHLAEQEQMLAEVRRVLVPGGLLIVSTPDRRLYSEATGQSNPYHERELTREEFSGLLSKTFANVGMFGQRTITGSHLGALDSQGDVTAPPSAFFIERAGEEWRLAGDPAALYMIALASDVPLEPVSSTSTLADCGLELMRASERGGAEFARTIASERDAALAREEVARDALDRLRLEIRHRDVRVDHLQGEIAGVRERLDGSERSAHELFVALEESRRLTRQVELSVTWQLFQRVRGGVFARVGEDKLPVRALRKMLRLGGRLLNRGARAVGPVIVAPPTAADDGAINFPQFQQPLVSLVIPLYSRPELTRRCLESIRDHTDEVGYEVILVDDGADEVTKELLEKVTGARVLADEGNQGYLRSVNRGASVALGQWIVLCNNDIEVTPAWLSAMVDCAVSRNSVGIVAPKFVSPEGELSEAGGILWSDATGVNYGRGEDPRLFHYEYTREIDYGSAAALLVSAELWRQAGGYDVRYEPMYYEDADLCMQARKLGWHVFYEPSAVVVHAEGSTAGTDPSSGYKRHQELNRVKFLDKWRVVLEKEHLAPADHNVRRAATRFGGPHVLVVDFRVPMWDRDAGSLRMFEIIRSLLGLGCRVTLMPDNFAPTEPYTRALQRMGVEVVYGPVDLIAEFGEIGPELAAAILSRPHAASRWLDTVREFAPQALLVYDTVDLHWVRESRRYMFNGPDLPKENGTIAVQGPKAAALLELELALVRASDITVTVTGAESAEIVKHVPDARVLIIPTVHKPSGSGALPSKRRGVIFVGGFEHPPNSDAAIYLVREVMPRVWASMGDVPVTIIGGSPPHEVLELAGPQVEVRGWVSDLVPLLDSARAMVVPVRYGAGIKGKITQALAAGLPVVTTPLGAEGLEALDGGEMLIGEDASALAERVVRVIVDDELWQSLSDGGLRLMRAGFSLEVLESRLREMLQRAGVPEAVVDGPTPLL